MYQASRFLMIIILLGVALPAFANPYARPNPNAGPGPQIKSQGSQPAAVLRDGITRLQKFLASGKADSPAELKTFVNGQVKTFFDFDRMSRLVGGPFYARLNPKQRKKFSSRVEAMFLKGFIRQVTAYSPRQPKIEFLPPRPSRDGREIVLQGRALFANGSAKRLVFRFGRNQEGEWRIFDVAANGSSAVLYYRKHFMNLARRQGPEALLR